MTKRNSKDTHEKFHQKTNIQKRIIDGENFTYRNIINEINQINTVGTKVLDIGCGAGTVSFYLASKGYKVFGIDISDKAIRNCQNSAKEMNMTETTEFKVMNFPYETPRKKFDFVLLTEVIEHLEDDEVALNKIFSMLNKNGVVLITTPSANAPLYRLGLTNKFDKEVGHLRRYNLSELEKKCNKAGFKVISVDKKEGILRNFLFINPVAGNLIRVINKFKLSSIVTILDNIFLKLFGESDLFIVAQKP